MELDFDKEIDTLLRKARHDGPVLVGDIASPHFNADEISAFAENAMPENSRALYTAHLADCDRCRKILSNVLMMNAEAVPAAASSSVITIAERSLPWYRRLFLFPNLAYLMGSLVLVFSGFLAFSVIQNSRTGESVVSQMSEPERTQGGPNFQDEALYAEGYANSSNMTANAASNTTSPNTAPVASNSNTSIAAAAPGERGPLAESALRGDRDVSIDGVDATIAPLPPPAAAQPAPREVRGRDELARTRTEDKVAGGVLKDSAKNEPMQKMYPGAPSQSQSGPMRNSENQYNRQLENLDRRALAKKASKEDEESSTGRKVVSGRTFERKQGVWYDTAYQSRPTINVRRGSAEFSRLDGGLRSIANSLSGTIVVVWGAKAYRIQ